MSQKNWTLFHKYDDIRQRTGQSPVCQAATYERAIKREDGMMDFILSTPGWKRDGLDIVQAGWMFDVFEKQGSLALWRHSDRNPTDLMGNWKRVWKSSAGGAPLHLRGTLEWVSEEKNPTARGVRLMYEDGNLRATSVRWWDDGPDSIEEVDGKEFEDGGQYADEKVAWYVPLIGGIRFLRAHLIEGAVCPIGMDKDAVAVRNLIRSGGVSAEMFVANAPLERTPEGREILLLDGHPARFEVERPTIVDLGAARVAGEGRTVVVETPDGTVTEHDPQLEDSTYRARAAQRLMRGDGDDVRRAAVTAAFERAGQPAPWASALGQSYAGMHEALAAAAEADAPTLRATIEQVGRHLFGDQRLREAWEPRTLPPGLRDIWEPLSEVLARILEPVVGSAVDADALTDTILAKAAEGCTPAMNSVAWMQRALAAVEAEAGHPVPIGDETHLRALLTAIRDLRARAAEPPPAPERAATDADAAAEGDAAEPDWGVADERLRGLRSRRTQKPPGAPPAKRRFDSLIDRITAPSPGKHDSSSATEG